MRTVTFKSVLHGVARRALGMDPDKDLNAATAARLTEWIQERYNEGLGHEWWPELMVVEERAVDATTFVIDAEEASKTPLGEVYSVTTRNPRTTRAPGPLAWEPIEDGLQLESTAPATAWVKFRMRPNVWTSVRWAAGNYTAGTTVYYATDGECYLCLANTNVVPGSDATKWQKLDFPYVLSAFVRKAAEADALMDLKQTSRGRAALAEAYERLEDSVDQVMGGQGQVDRIEVKTYGGWNR
jgi:hypothetical protein